MGPASWQTKGPLIPTNSGHPPVLMFFCLDHHYLLRPSMCWELHTPLGVGSSVWLGCAGLQVKPP